MREVENALALRESGAIVAALNAAMPALIAHYGAQLPAWAVQARRSAYRRIELHHCPVQGFQILALVWVRVRARRYTTIANSGASNRSGRASST